MSARITGKYFEELVPGDVYEHATTRTVTETDNLLFSALTHNTQPLHLDEEFSKKSIYGTRLVNSCFTLGLITGMSVNDLTFGTTLGNLGYDEIAFTNPVLIGDTLSGETRIICKRESKSRPDAGIVKFEHLGHNQRGEVVCKIVRTGLMMKRPVPAATA